MALCTVTEKWLPPDVAITVAGCLSSRSQVETATQFSEAPICAGVVDAGGVSSFRECSFRKFSAMAAAYKRRPIAAPASRSAA
jgi:hypothetical protein